MVRAPMNLQPPRRDMPRSNEEITNAEVRLIGADGQNLGIVPIERALEEASRAGLDLVEIAQGEGPPVVKVMDFGKYKYELQKKQHEARKNQKQIAVKEIKLRLNIESHDFEVKMRAARRFLEEGDKVKVSLRFRGREVTHRELGDALLQRVVSELEALSKVEAPPELEGRQLTMVLTPKS